jgi:hypothetical protein
MKRFATLSMVSAVFALEVLLTAVFFGGCLTADDTTAPHSAIVVADKGHRVG